MESTIFYGIDIAKKTFVSAVNINGQKKPQTKEWAYETDADIAAFVDSLPPNAHCLMEATGTYSSRLAYALYEGNIKVSVVNPKSVKHFAQMHGITTKTDKSDAQVILRFATQADAYRLFKPADDTMVSVQQHRTTLALLETQKQQLSNQLEGLRHHARPDIALIKFIEDQVLQKETDIDYLRDNIKKLIAQDYQESFDLLQSIPGIGPVVATLFINTFSTFLPSEDKNTGKSFAKFIGVSPINGSSGTSVRYKPHIGRSGAPILRAKMYIATVALCTRSKPDNIFRLFYEKLVRNGKSKKQAIIATIHKIVRIAVAVLESSTPFDLEKYAKAPVFQ